MNPMFQSMCKGYSLKKRAGVDEEDEFADEYSFHNDCLLTMLMRS